MKKKLFLTGIFSIILIFGFVVVGCGEIQYANTFFNHGPWTSSVMHMVNNERVEIDIQAVFEETTFTVSGTYNDEPVTDFGFSGKYKVSGYNAADLYEIVGASSTSGTADIRYVLQYGESLVIEGLGTLIFPR
jgi:hypothetical protein